MVGSVAVLAIFAPLVAPYPGDAGFVCHLEEALQPPSGEHLLGTDDMGRDLLSRILFGTRITLQVGVVSILLSTLIGVVLGMAAAYIGGVVDEIIMRTADLFMCVPYLVLGMALAVALKPGLTNLIIVVVAVFWPSTARMMRAEVLRVREEEYIISCQALGISLFRTMFRHITPNAITPVVVQSAIQAGWAILLAATLGFIGVGVQPPMPEWGLILGTARRFLAVAWWYSTFPGLAIVITVVGLNLTGDWLRNRYDPFLRN